MFFDIHEIHRTAEGIEHATVLMCAGLLLELSSTGQTEEENNMLSEWADELGLFVTYGSDWHGTMDEVGESIKKYLPYYTGELTGIEISAEAYRELRTHL